jgi:hypothetical protein
MKPTAVGIVVSLVAVQKVGMGAVIGMVEQMGRKMGRIPVVAEHLNSVLRYNVSNHQSLTPN